MKRQITLLNTLKYIFGLAALSFSVVLTFRTTLGASPADTLTVIVSDLTGMTKGLSAFLITGVIILFLTIYSRKWIFLILFGQILIFSGLIDLWDLVVLAGYYPSGMAIIVPFIISLLLMPLGCAFLIRSTYPAGVYDELIFFTSEVKKLRIYVDRTLNEPLWVALALILSLTTGRGFGAVYFGTFAYALTVGTMIKFYLEGFDYLAKIRRQHHEHQ